MIPSRKDLAVYVLACARLGTTRAEVMREALRKAIKDAKRKGDCHE